MVRGTMPNPLPAGKVSRSDLEFAGWMEKVRRTTHDASGMAGTILRGLEDTYATLHLWTQIVGKVRLG